MPDTVPDIVKTLLEQRAALEAQDAEYIARLVDAYKTIYSRLQGDIDALMLAIEKVGATSSGQVVRLSQYKRLMEDIERELVKYAGYVEVEIGAAARASMTMASADTKALMTQLLAETGIGADAIKILWPAAIEKLLGYLEPEGALFKKLGGLPGYTAKQVSDAIIAGVGVGKNPLTIADMITDKFGMALTDSMRMMRTVQLYSYREASRANYISNSDVVRGWVWYAEMDESTCMSCIAMHGTFHELDETLDDHHNGRCCMLPVTYTMDNPVDKTGEEWFNEQSEATQQNMMGKEKFDLWQADGFKFNELSRTGEDEVYGQMRTETPLWELLGAEPPLRTQ
jgi:hypothetical protein